jgi:cation diffusion facilitator family transporter
MERNKKVTFVLWLTLFFNLLVSAIKISIGLITQIGSILADGYHSLADGSSNIIGLISMRIAQKPVDSDHAYGHQRYETLATLFIVALLVFLGIEVFIKSILTFMNPTFSDLSHLTIALIVFALIINIVVATYQRIVGHQLNSTILIADSKHTASDIYISVGVLINLILIKYFNAPLWLDALTSLFVSIIIFKTAYSILRESAHELTDAIALDPKEIENIVLSNPLVISIHKIRSRKSGTHIFIDFHVQCDPNMSLIAVHNLSHELEELLKAHYGNDLGVIVHVEPEGYHYIKSV